MSVGIGNISMCFLLPLPLSVLWIPSSQTRILHLPVSTPVQLLTDTITVGAPLIGRISDRIVTRYLAVRRGVRIPEDRLRATLLGAFVLVPLPIMGFGAVLEAMSMGLAKKVGLGVVCVCLFLTGLGVRSLVLVTAG